MAYNNPQKVLIVKSPSDNKEQKQFLGYEWSAAKGNEGLKMTTTAQGSHLTPLYDPENRYNPEKINALIQDNFSGNAVVIPETLQTYTSQVSLVDLLDFSRKDFDKHINLSVKKNISIESKWEMVKLENIMKIVRGASPRPIDRYLTNEETGVAWIKIGDVSKGSKYITQTAEKITLEGAENSRAVKEGDFVLSNSMSFGRPYILKISGCIHDGWLLLSNFSEQINKDYLYEVLSYEDTQLQFTESAAGGVVQNLNTERVKTTKIPLPPLEIQTEIVQACEAIDAEVIAAQTSMEQAKSDIKPLLTNDKFPLEKLENVTIKVNEQIDPNNYDGEINYIGLENIESQTGRLVGDIRANYNQIKSAKTCFKINDVLYGKLRPNLNKVYLAKEEGICSTDILVFRFENECLAKYYAHYLLTDEFNKEVLKGVKGQQLPRTSWKHLSFIKVPYLNDLTTQQKLISEIEAQETIITAAQQIIDAAASKKQAILKQYL